MKQSRPVKQPSPVKHSSPVSQRRPVSHREPAVAAVLAVAGGALALWSATKTWVLVTTPRPAPLPAVHDSVTGRDAVPWAAAMAFLAIAGGVALFATRRTGRVVLGAVLALAGALISAGALLGARPGAQSFQHAAAHPAWPALFGIGGLAVAIGGALTLARGRRWAQLSARYDAPGSAKPPADGAPGLWDALDRGDDPTAENPPGS